MKTKSYQFTHKRIDGNAYISHVSSGGRDGVRVTKTFAKLLNFAIFLVVVSIGMSQVSYAATKETSSENNSAAIDVSNQSVATSNQSGSVQLDQSILEIAQSSNSDSNSQELYKDALAIASDNLDLDQKNNSKLFISNSNQIDNKSSIDAESINDNQEKLLTIAALPSKNALFTNITYVTQVNFYKTVKHNNRNFSQLNQTQTIWAELSPNSPAPNTPTGAANNGLAKLTATTAVNSILKNAFFELFTKTSSNYHQSFSIYNALIGAISSIVLFVILALVVIWLLSGFGRSIAPRGTTLAKSQVNLFYVKREWYDIVSNSLFNLLKNDKGLGYSMS